MGEAKRGRSQSVYYWDAGRGKRLGDTISTLSSTAIEIDPITNMTRVQKMRLKSVWQEINKEELRKAMDEWIVDKLPDVFSYFQELCWNESAGKTDLEELTQTRITQHTIKVIETMDKLVDCLLVPLKFKENVQNISKFHANLASPVDRYYFEAWSSEFANFFMDFVDMTEDVFIWAVFIQVMCSDGNQVENTIPGTPAEEANTNAKSTCCCCIS